MFRLKTIKENYDSAMLSIDSYLNDGDPGMKAIANLLVSTDVNPYGFLPNAYAGGFDTAGGFKTLLDTIHHALVDDGEISFPIVDGEPRIVFVLQWQDNYEDYVLNQTEKHCKQKYGNTYSIEQCQDVFVFIEKFKEYNCTQLKRWFIADAARIGFDFAVKHYSKYLEFNPEWKTDEDILDQIEYVKNRRNGSRPGAKK